MSETNDHPRRPRSTPEALVDLRDYLYGLGLAENSVRNYHQFARRFLSWCWTQGVDPSDPGPSNVRRWGDTLPDTYASRAAAHKGLIHWFRFLGRVDPTLWDALTIPTKPRMVSRALEPDDAGRLVRAALMVGGREAVATLCGLYLAARRSEIAALTWEGWTGERFRFQRSKSKDIHEVPVHPILRRELTTYREAGTSSSYLFPGDRGRPHVTPATVWEWVRHVGVLAGLDVTVHQLRHTALTVALESSKDLAAVQLLAGHRDPMQTAGYVRVSSHRIEATVAGLDYLDGGGDR